MDVLLNADFEGCEIRVAAGLSGDKGLYEAEISKKCHLCQADPCSCGKKHTGLHWMAAHLTFGEGATKENRYKCKAVIFKKLFGGVPDSPVAEKIDRTFDEQIAPVYHEWDQWLRKCYKQGMMVWRDYNTGQNYAQDIEGRRRGIYRAYSGRNIYCTKGEHAFGNSAIQGTARELLVDGALRWKQVVREHPEWGVKAFLPIHDEALTWCREEYFEPAIKALARCMETDILSSPGFEVHIGADPTLEKYAFWPDSS